MNTIRDPHQRFRLLGFLVPLRMSRAALLCSVAALGIGFYAHSLRGTEAMTVQQAVEILNSHGTDGQKIGAAALFRNAWYSIERLEELAEAGDDQAAKQARVYLGQIRSKLR